MWHGTGEMSDSETKCISYKHLPRNRFFFFFFFLRVIYQGLMKTFCSERKNVVFKFSVLSALGDGQGRW